ncbi:thiamine biosynthesis protein (Thi-4) [Hyaloraphidium curvatum]|nr:thiamine biosynthesis protein (Thi-4) [Hyaloraphidium curvatum]
MATPTALTIAGSDSGGGAGIQADLKTFSAFGVFGTSVVAALTAQNTKGVQGVVAVEPSFVEAQCESVLSDIGAGAVKTGMLFSAPIIGVVASQLRKHGVARLVVDPVMVSSSGSRLLSEDAVAALAEDLIPLATVLTPNTPEAEVLLQQAGRPMKIASVEDMKVAARAIREAFGPQYVLLKGGHLPVSDIASPEVDDVRTVFLPSPTPDAKGQNGAASHVVDVLYDGQTFVQYPKPHRRTRNLHGTGCTLSAAIAAGLALGKPVPEAVEAALVYLSKAIAPGKPFAVGTGAHGPVNHLHSITAVATLLEAPSAPPPAPWSAVGAGTDLASRLIASCPAEWQFFVDHPFVRGMADGTLPPESFRHYMVQDYLYLTHFARAYALAAYKEQRMDDILRAAGTVLQIGRETELHVAWCARLGISKEELDAAPEAVANLSYTRFFLEKGVSGDRLDLRVALAPCLLGYGVIGKRLAEDPATKRDGNPYWEWIEAYAADDYQEACREGREELEKLSKELLPESSKARMRQLCETFRQGTVLEAKFWDMGLHLQD